MATNRKRKLRTSNKIPLKVTPEYVRRLKLRDFMGSLTEAEITLAKEIGVYKWDAWAKERHRRRENQNNETP